MHYLLQNFSHISDSFHLFRWFEWSFDGEFDKHYLITVCDIAWSNLPQQVLDRLQQLQNRSARIITCCSRSSEVPGGGGGGYSHTLPIRVCAAQRGRYFEAISFQQILLPQG